MSDYWDDVMRADYAEYMAEQSGKASGKKTKSSKTDTRKTKKRKVRYARVPSGAETCAFCIMLASRDFIYASEQTASHAHAHCDCRIVPGFTGETKVEGYDPDALKDQYLEARKAVEAMFTKADWEFVPGDLRTKLILQEMRKQLKEGAAKDKHGTAVEEVAVTGGRGASVSRGELYDLNDPWRVARCKHAIAYYETVRKRDRQSELDAVSKSSGLAVEEVAAAYNHLLIVAHDLDKGFVRFDADYDIAQSWQRLRSNEKVQPHDITLIRHEALESHFMASENMNYTEAHDAANKTFNYEKAMREYLLKREKGDSMLFLKLREANSEKVIYDFFPESLENEYGTISVSLSTREPELVKDTSRNYPSVYKGHALSNILEMIDKGQLRDELQVAWY